MQRANDTPGPARTRGSSSLREIVLALALTLGAVLFMVATIAPANDPASVASPQSRP